MNYFILNYFTILYTIMWGTIYIYSVERNEPTNQGFENESYDKKTVARWLY